MQRHREWLVVEIAVAIHSVNLKPERQTLRGFRVFAYSKHQHAEAGIGWRDID
ncbi:hypothetical protein ACF8Q9_22230 [Pseudomonas sp. TYF_15]|uniref:hypothetical protein n=1 Tax=Pseudomonas sp. TYF_15 TaxID=3367194 RepID=UPI003709F7A0